jgi:hypothetical protein
MADFSAHAAEISRDTDVKNSAMKLINTFQSRLDQGIADAVAANDAVDLTTLDALSADLRASTDALAAAVAANTPAESMPAEPPV